MARNEHQHKISLPPAKLNCYRNLIEKDAQKYRNIISLIEFMLFQKFFIIKLHSFKQEFLFDEAFDFQLGHLSVSLFVCAFIANKQAKNRRKDRKLGKPGKNERENKNAAEPKLLMENLVKFSLQLNEMHNDGDDDNDL